MKTLAHTISIQSGFSDRALLPRPRQQRPEQLVPGDDKPASRALAHQRAAINRTARDQVEGQLHVVLYALTLPGRDPHDDLAAGQGGAARHGLAIADRIVDTLDDRTEGDDPTLRRGYARALRLLADRASPVRGDWP